MMLDVDKYGAFTLPDDFLAEYRKRPVAWGFGALSRVTYLRTYSRDGEAWWQTCRRVIEGMFTIQRVYRAEHRLPWDAAKADATAREAYERLFAFRWTPPGRGLWIMGTRFMYERGGAALNNCGFVSTRDLEADFAAPFLWMFRMSMLGVGVGFDTRGKNRLRIQSAARGDDTHTIDDSREGWGRALERLLSAYAGTGALPRQWDYGSIRPRGTRLKSFGGYASGPEPLREMLDSLTALLDGYANRTVDATLIVDAMNLIGRCVVAGGIRRSAQIALGEAGDNGFLDLKQDRDKVTAYRWVSNHSIFAEPGMDYAPAAERTAINGEPGYFWLDNARRYGRFKDPRNDADAAAEGCNPCVEQTLWNRELCCLAETYPAHHDSLEDYLATLRIAYEYAKTVTLVATQDPAANAVMEGNRRLGCSMTGVVQAINRFGYRTFFQWCDKAYEAVRRWDRAFSDELHVPRSIKLTSVKPSGTVSLLAGATPGVHWPHAPYYLRRIRVADGHALAELCRNAGYPVEPDAYSGGTVVVSFPVHAANTQRRRADVSLREQIDLAARMQHYWSDNQVSCTATFDPETERGEVARILTAYEDRLKAVAFLPADRHGYEQPPYEAISRQRYEKLRSGLKPLRGDVPHEEQLEARFCEGEECEIDKERR